MPNRIKIDNLQQETKELSDSEQKEIVGGATLAETQAALNTQDAMNKLQTATETSTKQATSSHDLARSIISNSIR